MGEGRRATRVEPRQRLVASRPAALRRCKIMAATGCMIMYGARSNTQRLVVPLRTWSTATGWLLWPFDRGSHIISPLLLPDISSASISSFFRRQRGPSSQAFCFNGTSSSFPSSAYESPTATDHQHQPPEENRVQLRDAVDRGAHKHARSQERVSGLGVKKHYCTHLARCRRFCTARGFVASSISS